MKYLLLIHSDETIYPKKTEAEMTALLTEFARFTAALKDAGALVGANRLRPTTTATTVRVREGKMLTTDGPFAETKEQLGGYYLIDVENLDDALAWAAKIPSARHGSIEVRPVWDMSEEIPGLG